MRAMRELAFAIWRFSSTGRRTSSVGAMPPCRSASAESFESSGRQVLEPLGHDVDDACSDCSLPVTARKRAPSTTGAESLEHLRPDDDVGDAGLVLERDEDDARRRARPLADQDEARRR